MKNIKISLLTLITLLLLSNYSYPGNLKVLHEKSYHIAPGKELKLETSTGDIMISSWDMDEVYIKVLGNEKAEDKMSFDFNANENVVEVIAKKEGSFFNWFGSSGISLRFEIKVPKSFNNKVSTSGGDIKLADVKGKTLLKTSGGDINAKSFDGDLYASTSGGDIKLKGTNSKIEAETSGGDISLEYWGVNKGIDLSTSGGDIYIKVPTDFSAKVKLTTSGGDISTEIGVNNVKKMSSHKLEGELNKGGSPLNATTPGGDIVVSKM